MPKSTYVAVDNGRNGALNFRNFDLEFKVDNMNNKIQLKSRLGGTMLTLGLLALYFTRSRIELFQKAESVTLATHQEQTYVLYGCCSGNLQ